MNLKEKVKSLLGLETVSKSDIEEVARLLDAESKTASPAPVAPTVLIPPEVQESVNRLSDELAANKAALAKEQKEREDMQRREAERMQAEREAKITAAIADMKAKQLLAADDEAGEKLWRSLMEKDFDTAKALSEKQAPLLPNNPPKTVAPAGAQNGAAPGAQASDRATLEAQAKQELAAAFSGIK